MVTCQALTCLILYNLHRNEIKKYSSSSQHSVKKSDKVQ